MTKRANGEGSVYLRKDGRWAGSVTLPTGRRKHVYGRTRKEVGDRISTMLANLQKGVMPTPENLTVRNLLEQWLSEGAPSTVRPSTLRSYSDISRLHLVPALGRVRLAKLQPQHIERLLKAKIDEGLSPRRVQYIHAVLRRVLGRAVRWGLLTRNVATLVDLPQVVRPEVQPLTFEQIRHFLATIKGDRMEALYVVALTTGMRQGELLGLRWSDVDLKTGRIQIRRTLQRLNGQFLYGEPKSARSKRAVMLPATVRNDLDQHRIRQECERSAAGPSWEDNDLVFASKLGRPLDGTNMTHRFQKKLKEAGISRRPFHDLRHSAATVLLALGVQGRVLMEILGHSQLSVTMNTYAHVLPEQQQDAADRMDVFLRGPGEPDDEKS